VTRENWLERDPVMHHAQVRPDHIAVIDFKSGQRLNYSALNERVARAAGWLKQTLGEHTLGQRVAYLGRNSIEQVAILFGCHRVGAIFQPMNWRLTGLELAVLIEDAAPVLLIYEAEFEACAREALAAQPVQMVFSISATGDELAEAIAASSPIEPDAVPNEAPFILLYTSGTTGRPKGAVITRLNAFYSGVNFASVGQVTPRAVMLCDAPMFHTVGLMAATRTTLQTGGTLALSDRFLPGPTLARLSDRTLNITHYFAVPQIAQMLREHPDYPTSDLTGLTALFTGGAPMPAELIKAFLADGVTLSNGYGMTEVGTVMHVPLDKAIIANRLDWAGVPAPAVAVRVVRPDGADAAPNEPGEIWMKGPAIMTGDWNRPDEDARAFHNGWFKSGDAGLMDEHGFFRLIDRWKDMYISGGENVYPAEVEAVLAAHPGVQEVAVVGYPDSKWGESGCAFVVGAEGLEEAGVLSGCFDRLARYKHPRQVRFVSELPRTASGKVRKDTLRAMLAAE